MSRAFFPIQTLAPPSNEALGMIAQRKPNLDKGFKDLPLCNGLFRAGSVGPITRGSLSYAKAA
jgi:hypothetical protein